MHIDACHVVAKWNPDGVEGFTLMATRWVGHSDPVEQAAEGTPSVTKGPFYSHQEAIDYAKSWKDAEKPPPIPPHQPLEINGCSVTAEVCETAPDGYQSSVSREITETGEVPAGSPEGTPAPVTTRKITQGPFDSAKGAVAYAHSWEDPEHPPAMPVKSSSEPPKQESKPDDDTKPVKPPNTESEDGKSADPPDTGEKAEVTTTGEKAAQ